MRYATILSALFYALEQAWSSHIAILFNDETDEGYVAQLAAILEQIDYINTTICEPTARTMEYVFGYNPILIDKVREYIASHTA